MNKKYYKVFTAGIYPQGTYTEKDVMEMAESYDRNYHEAPLTLNHDEESPAYAAVNSVIAKGKDLFVGFDEIHPEAYDVNKKHKKPSIEIADYNGKKYLRAVSLTNFPQVKGLDKITFKEDAGNENNNTPVFTGGSAVLFKENSALIFNEKLTLDLTKGVSMFNEKIIKLAEVLNINISDYRVEEDVVAKASEIVASLQNELGEMKNKVQSLSINLSKFEDAGVTVEKFNEMKTEAEQLQTERINELVSRAINNKNFMPAGKESLTKFAETDFESAKKFVDSLPERTPVPSIPKVPTHFTGAQAEVTYEQILENPALASKFSDAEITELKKKSTLFT